MSHDCESNECMDTEITTKEIQMLYAISTASARLARNLGIILNTCQWEKAEEYVKEFRKGSAAIADAIDWLNSQFSEEVSENSDETQHTEQKS